MAKLGRVGGALGMGDSSCDCDSGLGGGGGGDAGDCSTFGAGVGGSAVGVALFRASSVFLSICGAFFGTGLASTLGCTRLIKSGGRSRYFRSSLRWRMASKGSITGGTLKIYFGIQVSPESRT